MILEEAIKHRNVLLFDYNGKQRVVEPHAYGVSRKGELILRAFQIAGDSDSDQVGWKLFNVGGISNLDVSSETFNRPRDGYRTGDSAMTSVLAELEPVGG